MNIPVSKNGSIKWDSPVSKPGDKILFKAEIGETNGQAAVSLKSRI